MFVPLWTAAIALLAGQMFPYAGIKTWTGTVSVDVIHKAATEPGAPVTSVTYSAAGAVTLVDELTPPGGTHSVWPFPSAAETADPQRAANAFKRWPARVTFLQRTQGTDELGQKVDFSCRGETTTLSRVQLMMVPDGRQIELAIEPPPIGNVPCTGTSVLPANYVMPRTELKLRRPVGPAGAAIAGTETITIDGAAITITFKLTPS